MAMEKYIAIGSIVMYAIFAAEMITLFNFMIESTDADFFRDPAAKVLQFISISAAPGLVLTGTSWMLARKFGSKQVGSIIIAGGIVLLVGMLYANIMLGQLDNKFHVFTVDITPPLFMCVSIPIMIFGARLFKLKKRPKKYF
jgi:hypothetical protein